MPRAAKTPLKLKIVKSKEVPSTVVFSRSLLRPSPYVAKLQELSATPDAVLVIGDSAGQIISVRKAAEKLGLDLAFARSNGDVLVRIMTLSESQHRLFLLLREARTLNELKASDLELNVEQELKDLAAQSYASLDRQGKWKLTEEGLARLKARKL